jgi:hypothetical protein
LALTLHHEGTASGILALRVISLLPSRSHLSAALCSVCCHDNRILRVVFLQPLPSRSFHLPLHSPSHLTDQASIAVRSFVPNIYPYRPSALLFETNRCGRHLLYSLHGRNTLKIKINHLVSFFSHVSTPHRLLHIRQLRVSKTASTVLRLIDRRKCSPCKALADEGLPQASVPSDSRPR